MTDAGTAAMSAARLRECERARDELGAEVERLARERDEACALAEERGALWGAEACGGHVGDEWARAVCARRRER